MKERKQNMERKEPEKKASRIQKQGNWNNYEKRQNRKLYEDIYKKTRKKLYLEYLKESGEEIGEEDWSENPFTETNAIEFAKYYADICARNFVSEYRDRQARFLNRCASNGIPVEKIADITDLPCGYINYKLRKDWNEHETKEQSWDEFEEKLILKSYVKAYGKQYLYLYTRRLKEAYNEVLEGIDADSFKVDDIENLGSEFAREMCGRDLELGAECAADIYTENFMPEYTDEINRRIIRCFKNGLSLEEIANLTEVPYEYIGRLLLPKETLQ